MTGMDERGKRVGKVVSRGEALSLMRRKRGHANKTHGGADAKRSHAE